MKPEPVRKEEIRTHRVDGLYTHDCVKVNDVISAVELARDLFKKIISSNRGCKCKVCGVLNLIYIRKEDICIDCALDRAFQIAKKDEKKKNTD